MTEPTLKLYVWTKFCPDYSDGLAFAIAENVDDAQRLIRERSYLEDTLMHDPSDWGPVKEFELNEKLAFCVTGGM